MAPLTPTWTRPSHPDVQEVIINEAEFTSKSLSRVAVPPFGLFARMTFPPCTVAEDGATYATVQFGRDRHLNLNSDLLYINHSCEPSLIFDTTNFNVLAGPKGLQPGDELTFFYPSTEWSMAQTFTCLCGTPSCRGRISGARDMTDEQLQGVWLNGHIRDLLEEQRGFSSKGVASVPENGIAASSETPDVTAQALKDALLHAEKVVEAARTALKSYIQGLDGTGRNGKANGHGHVANGGSGPNSGPFHGMAAGSERRGPTSRELSGEMGGDTICT